MNVHGIDVPNEQLVGLVRDGSPFLLGSLGRLFGLGQSEQGALVRGEVPRYAVLGLGLVVGFAVGVLIYHHYPETMSKAVG